MRGSATLLAVTLAALGAGYVGGGLGGGAGTPEIDELARRIDALAVAPPAAVRARGRASVERPTDEDRRIDALADSVAAFREAAEAATPVADEAAADVRRLQKLDVATLRDEIDARLERFLSPRAWANSPVKERDAEASVRACDVLLARELKPTERATALLQKGRALGVLGTREAEEAAFRDAIAAVGPASALGHVAQAHLGWTASRCKEPRVAAERFLVVAEQPDATPRERSMYQLFAANGLAGAGDVARARELYRAVSIEFGTSGDANARKFAADSLAALKNLDEGGGGR